MIPALKAKATAALNHRDLAAVVEGMPRDNPAAAAAWLRTFASVHPGLADNAAFRSAVGAVQAWGEGQALADRAAALYHNQDLRREFSESAMAYYWSHPEEAYRTLVADGARRGKDAELANEVMQVIVGGRMLAQEHGFAWDGQAAAPAISSDPKAQDAEYRELINIAPNKLTAAQHQRLLMLADGRVQREEAELSRAFEQQQRPQPQPAATGSAEYRSLVAKSLKGRLSSADERRLSELALERAFSEGGVDPAVARDPNAGAPFRGEAPSRRPTAADWDRDAAAEQRAIAAGIRQPAAQPETSSDDGGF